MSPLQLTPDMIVRRGSVVVVNEAESERARKTYAAARAAELRRFRAMFQGRS